MSRRAAPPPDDSPLDRLKARLRWLLARAGGIALIVLGLITFLSVATFSISDPSLSTATGRVDVENWMGRPGAVIADVLLQSLGGAALWLPLAPMFWSAGAIRDGVPGATTPPAAWGKGAAWLGSVVAMAGFAGALPWAADWPFLVSMGGLLGGGVAALATAPFALIGLPLAGAFGAVLLLALAVWLSAHSIGVYRDHVEAALEAVEFCADLAMQRLRHAVEWVSAQRDARRSGEAVRLTPRFEAQADDPDAADAADMGADDDHVPGFGPELDVDAANDSDGAEDVDARPRRKVRKVKSRRAEAADGPLFDTGDYELPSVKLLRTPSVDRVRVTPMAELEARARLLETVLADFKVDGAVINVRPGPVVTLYEFEPAAGVKSARVINLADDIARSMSAIACRVAVIPGRNAIGVELPNEDREMVYFQEMLTTADYAEAKGLCLALGKDIGGQPQYADLSKMPHLLIAGTTGSGKSVGINTMILSLLYRLTPAQCKMIMIDPKMLELSVYEGIPHLLAPVVTDPRKAVVALKWTVREMEQRYKAMQRVGVRNIHGFNEKIAEAESRGEELTRRMMTGYDPETGEPVYQEEVLDFELMPFIVVVIDEVADLMMVAGKDIEGMVQRLAQMARAAGIHLIMATQRPSVDVITGTIKANFPTRISFQVTSRIDSRTILNCEGAEQLLGQGDMLYMAGGGRIGRVHGAFVADDEVEKVVSHLKRQGKPDYVQEVTEVADDETAEMLGLDTGGNTSSGDALYDQAVAVIARDRKASTSYIQRRLQIGYNRAASLMERLEEDGVVGPANHAGKREVLIGEDAA